MNSANGAELERELEQAFAAVPSPDLQRRIEGRVGRAIALAPQRERRTRWLAAALIAGAILLVGAGYYVITQSPIPSALNPGQPLACTGLVGGSPDTAAVNLAERGYQVVWVVETTDADDPRFGSARRVDAMPSGVVLDVAVRGSEAEVRVTPADDPLANTAAERADAERAACP